MASRLGIPVLFAIAALWMAGCPRKSAPASAVADDEDPSRSADTATAGGLTRFADEVPLGQPSVVAHDKTRVRKAPGTGDVVATLPVGTEVLKLASRAKEDLVAFDDPEGGGRTAGWLPEWALAEPAPAAPPASPPAEDAGTGAIVERSVLPSTTEAAIRDPNDPHVVLVPPSPRNGKLLVFMPGTHGKPQETAFLSAAARDGYLVIGLSYPDSEPATMCKSDIHCFDGFRRDIFEGTSGHAIRSSHGAKKVEVSPTNSIKNRLVKLLVYLDSQFPTEGWRAFLAGNDLAYASIAFAGISQGGGFAAYIAKNHVVARVLMFSSVVDASDGNPPIPAHWVSTGHVTPIDRYYGFGHVNDGFAKKIAADWSALGLEELGRRHSVDGDKPPFGNSHQLVTAISEPDDHQAHVSVLAAKVTTPTGDVPKFLEVWEYMLLH